ncbi:MAG: histidine ammonia-lyase [Bellilinea sp.]|jgi:histidine ammonia-lyase
MIELDGNHLHLDSVIAVARRHEQVAIAPGGYLTLRRSRQVLENILKSDRPVYGINTGFGVFSEQRIPLDDSNRLSRNLILSHAVASGNPLPSEVVRAAMLVRANTLVKGCSGVRVEVVETLIEMLNRGVTPRVPEQGSLGSSGDLSPLSHLALVFTTDEQDLDEESGWAEFEGKTLSGKAAMQAAGIPRIILGPKEGLAINNGATFCAAIAALTVYDALRLIQIGTQASALSLEATLGCSSAFDARIHDARGQQGQMRIAEAIRSQTANSAYLDAAGRVQDAYSLRCVPQVHGAVLDTVEFARNIVEREINAATDNPLLFEPEVAISGGNFHGEPIGLVMDFVGIALAELAAISERRTFRLLDAKLNCGLPAMLVDSVESAGLNSGLMMPHYTAAAIVLENQTLAHPDSVHSLPTSGGQEDHNANAMTAARHAMQILNNATRVLAIELYTAARAMDLRNRQMPNHVMGNGTRMLLEKIRQKVPYTRGDAWWSPEIDRLHDLIVTGFFES